MSTIIALEVTRPSRGAQGLSVLGQETGQFFMKVKNGAGSNHGCYLNRVGQKRIFFFFFFFFSKKDILGDTCGPRDLGGMSPVW